MIEVHERFKVEANPESVWAIVSDPRAVVACISGAQLLEQHEDGTYSGAMQIKFGPVQVTFSARVSFEVDEVARTGRVKGKGKDAAGTKSELEFTFTVGEGHPGTELTGDGLVSIRGPLAGMIEAGAAIVIKRLLGEFSEQITKRANGQVASDSPASPSEPTEQGILGRVTQSVQSLFRSKTQERS